MGSEGISLKSKEKLSEIINDKVKDIKRFKEGFHNTIKRNVELKTITSQEGTELLIILENKIF